jgi:hypothetical protein
MSTGNSQQVSGWGADTHPLAVVPWLIEWMSRLSRTTSSNGRSPASAEERVDDGGENENSSGGGVLQSSTTPTCQTGIRQ